MASSVESDDAAFAELLGELAHAPRLPLVRANGRRSAGERIGPYELRSLIGEGGMGVVYRARDLRLGRDVALKLVRPAHVRPDIVQRFVREARALASVKSAHVVAIHDLGLEEDVPFLALELLDGDSLRERLKPGPLPLDEAVRIVDALLQGLAVVHARGIVHRDLKPENVFLCRNGDVKILDFGLAKLAAGHVEEGAGAKTDAGTVLGTAYYMAPEQVKSAPISPATDLYAIGALLYELVSGLVPYDAPTPIQIMLAIVGSKHVPLAERNPSLPKGVAQFVERCLEKEPERRFSSAEDARHALANACKEPSSPARPRPATQPTTGYARAGDVHLGYQTMGAGPPDLVVVPGFVSNIEQLWEEAESRAFFSHLAEHARLVMFDKRNTGLSDRVMGAGTLDERVSDLLAVMDSVGSERSVLMGVSEGAAIALACAATAPARVTGLVLYAGFAHHAHSARLVEIRRIVKEAWGSGSTIDLFAPSVARDPDKRAFWARWERLGANPGAVVAHVDMLARLDVRPLLSAVSTPALLLHRRGDRVVPVEASRRLHEQLPGSVLREYEGDDHAPMFGDTRAMLADIAEFVARCSAGPAARR